MLFRACGLAAFALVLLLVSARASPAAAADRLGRDAVVLGWSVDGRAIRAIETGDFDASRRALVVGCVHGNETAGIAIANRLAHDAPPKEIDLWIVPGLNPDGGVADTRGNAHDVDLNRNFPWRWQPLGGVYYSGPRPLSEPESRIAYRLITKLNPQVSVWFHQRLDLVDESGGSIAVERRFARLARLRLARLNREPGSAVGWENPRDPAWTAFVVELPPGSLATAAVTRFAHAVLDVTTASHRNVGVP